MELSAFNVRNGYVNGLTEDGGCRVALSPNLSMCFPDKRYPLGTKVKVIVDYVAGKITEVTTLTELEHNDPLLPGEVTEDDLD